MVSRQSGFNFLRDFWARPTLRRILSADAVQTKGTWSWFLRRGRRMVAISS